MYIILLQVYVVEICIYLNNKPINTHQQNMSSDKFLVYPDGYGNFGHAINTNHWSGYDSGCWGAKFDPTNMPKTLEELFLNAHDFGSCFYESGGLQKWKYVELSGAMAHGCEYLVRYHEEIPKQHVFALFEIDQDEKVTLIKCHADGFLEWQKKTSELKIDD